MHSCLATWWAALRDGPMPADFAWPTQLVRAGLERAARIVCPSAAFAGAVRAAYGLPASPAVVHNGRAPDPEQPAAEPIEAVFTAGRLWDEGKNGRTLDRVAALTMAPFRAAGPTQGPDGSTISFTHLQALGTLSEPDMRRHFAERPVYATAALYEPFGLAVLEAAQAGCALVLSDIDNFRELWGDAALFVPPRDEEGFAAAIGRLLSDGELRAEYAHAARNRARAFGLDAFAGDMLNLYQGVLQTDLGIFRPVGEPSFIHPVPELMHLGMVDRNARPAFQRDVLLI